MKSVKSFLLCLVICECVIAFCLYYLYSQPGFSGIIKWEPKYLWMFIRGLLLLLGPIIAFTVYVVFVKKNPRVVLFAGISLSCLSVVAALFIVGRLVFIGSRMPPSHSVIDNLISAGESLP